MLPRVFLVLAFALSGCDDVDGTRTDADIDIDGPADLFDGDTGADAGEDADGDVDPDSGPDTRRVVAMGDLHGDLDQTLAALRIAGVIDEEQVWVGGTTYLVQVGDILDRGADERAVIDLFEELRPQAEDAGGMVVNLIGNHETMNADGDYRYVVDDACDDFDDLEGLDTTRSEFDGLSEGCKIRAAAFWPGGPYARILAEWHVVLVLEDSVFVHGGLLPTHVDYGIDALNAETSAWFRGEGEVPWDVVYGADDAVDWDRTYSDPDAPPSVAACNALEGVLSELGVSRLVVGHTPQDVINSVCDGAAWRVDVGIASYYGGAIQLLDIRGDEVTTIP